MAKKKSKSKKGQTFERLETGIEGLDRILDGGFLKGATYLITGEPGTGKTILSNQLSFHQISKGGSAVYVTLLAENHARMFGNLDSLKFFDRDQISNSIHYISGYNALENDGLEGLLRLLSETVLRHKADVLFIDGVASAGALAESPVDFKKFVHHLNSVVGLAGCTTFLLSSAEGETIKPEHTMVDGIVSLMLYREGMQMAREIEVRKFRGSSHLFGRHFYEITANGLEVYPRVEAALKDERVPTTDIKNLLSTGVPGLDQLMGGGVTKGSVTSFLGPSGNGKTMMGMQFLLEGVARKENALYFSMYEHPVRIEAKFSKLGRPFSRALKDGRLHIIRRSTGMFILDKIVWELLRAVRENNIKRLFIDGIAGLQSHSLRSDRLMEVMTALAHELRGLGVTSAFVEESDFDISNPGGPISNQSAITDNIVLLRLFEVSETRTRTVSIIKSRETVHDPKVHELLFTKDGVIVGDPMKIAEMKTETPRSSTLRPKFKQGRQ